MGYSEGCSNKKVQLLKKPLDPSFSSSAQTELKTYFASTSDKGKTLIPLEPEIIESKVLTKSVPETSESKNLMRSGPSIQKSKVRKNLEPKNIKSRVLKILKPKTYGSKVLKGSESKVQTYPGKKIISTKYGMSLDLFIRKRLIIKRSL